MDYADLVVVRSFTSRVEAEIARAALEAFDVKSLLSADDPEMRHITTVRLLVRAEDVEKAEEILGEPK